MPDAGTIERTSGSSAGEGVRVAGLDHVVLRVGDLDRAIDFYGRVLNCRVERRLEQPQLDADEPEDDSVGGQREGDRSQLRESELGRAQVHGYDLACVAFAGHHEYVSGADEKVRKFT